MSKLDKELLKGILCEPSMGIAIPALFITLGAVYLGKWELVFQGAFLCALSLIYALNAQLRKATDRIIDAQREYIGEIEDTLIFLGERVDTQQLSAIQKEKLSVLLTAVSRRREP